MKIRLYDGIIICHYVKCQRIYLMVSDSTWVYIGMCISLANVTFVVKSPFFHCSILNLRKLIAEWFFANTNNPLYN